MWKLRVKNKAAPYRIYEYDFSTRGDCEDYYRLHLKPFQYELVSIKRKDGKTTPDPLEGIIKL